MEHQVTKDNEHSKIETNEFHNCLSLLPRESFQDMEEEEKFGVNQPCPSVEMRAWEYQSG